jgi:ribonuclease III
MKNLFDRAKLFFCKDREFRSALYDIMGFCPHNIDLYRTAFAHKSQEYRSKKLGNKPLNNERLEFLGDAVLETVVSHIVYRHFPNKREGFLTNTRSKIVSRESLGKLAKELHIDRLIQSQTHSRTHNSYLGGNSFEALMGAIYLDRGFRYAFRFVEQRIIGAVLDLESVASKEVNFKSKLLEWSQKNRIRLEFKDSAPDTDKANGPSFLTTIVIEGLYAGEGKGYSKKESHQTAAKDALTKLRREPQFLDSVFRAKEKRTAMGAEEFFTVPKIDEIEAEIAKEQSEGAPARKDNARNERSRKEKGGEQRNDKRADRQKENREDKNTERKNTKARGEKQDEDGAKGNTERKDRKNKFAPMQLPAAIADELKPEQPKETVTSDEPTTSVAESTDERDTPSSQEKHDASPDANSVSPAEQPAAQEADPSVASAPDRSAEESETPAASADEVPEEAPAPRTEQQKKRARRQNKAQNAAGYTNTTPPPAEQSRRAEKAERRLREEAHRRDVERAQNDLAGEAERTDTSEEESSDAQPTARRNNRRRRGGARRRKNGRNNGNAENGNADNAPQQDAAPN